jgi:hypothetical protein
MKPRLQFKDAVYLHSRRPKIAASDACGDMVGCGEKMHFRFVRRPKIAASDACRDIVGCGEKMHFLFDLKWQLMSHIDTWADLSEHEG